MKKLTVTLSLALFGFLAINQSAQAQENFGSIGIEAAMPFGDWSEESSIGVGASIGYEMGLSEKFGIGVNVGYTYLTANDYEIESVTFDDEGNSTIVTEERDGFSSALIPLQVYARFYFDEARNGFFASVKTGAHIQSRTYEYYDAQAEEWKDETNTNTNFGVAPELGFFITENISVALRYQFLFVTVESATVDYEFDSEVGIVEGQVQYVEETDTYGYLGLRAAFNF